MSHDDPFAGETVQAALAYYLDTSGTYTPDLTATTTDPDLGADGSINGSWHRNGHLISMWVRIHFSGAGLSAGSGIYEISTPFNGDSSIMPGEAIIGSGYIVDNDVVGNRQPIAVRLQSSEVVRLRPTGASFVTDSTPFTWASDDFIYLAAFYLADPAGLPS